MNQDYIEKVLAEFDKAFKSKQDTIFRWDRGLNTDLKDFLRLALENQRKGLEWEWEKKQVEEWQHEQHKLLDGFSHPKDCKVCNPPNQQ